MAFDLPRHEAEIARQTSKAFFRLFRHPTEIPSFCREIVSSTRDYYAARDVVDLDRQEVVQLLAWTRKLTMKMTGGALFLGALVCLALVKGGRAEEPWTPDDFDWSSLKVAPKDQWSGLYINLTTNPLPTHAALYQMGNPGVIGGHDVLFVAFSLGLLWRGFKAAAAVGGIVTAIQGCVTNDGSASAVAGCTFGIAGTIVGIGSAYKAASSAGWFARAANTWDNSGLESIALDVFSKRSQDFYQEYHEALISDVLRQAFGDDPEFIGYVNDGHRLSRRDDEHLHARAPIFRIDHPRHGLMDIASRDHVNGTRITATYANHGLQPRQTFQHEHLSDHVFEGRFDGPAQAADPANPDFDAAGGYQEIEDSINCFAGGTWQPGDVMDVQMYDVTNEATFAFASLGIFENNDADSELQNLQPAGMPLPAPAC